MGIRDREMSGGLGQNNRWPRISKSLKIQRVIQDIVSNARLTDAEGQNASIDDRNLQLSQSFRAITVNNIENIRDIFKKDIKEKRARYIQGNNQLMQEFSFASTWTKVFINRVYNGHHYGAVLWDLYGKETEHLEYINQKDAEN